MTNEEKAKEIELDVYAFGEKPKGQFEAPAYRAALAMAEWKDRQFREILRKRWKESQANPNDEQLKIALFDEIMDIFLGED